MTYLAGLAYVLGGGYALLHRKHVLVDLVYQPVKDRGGTLRAVFDIAGFALFAVTAGVFVTAFYSFRMYFLVFHGEERFGHGHEVHHAADDAEEAQHTADDAKHGEHHGLGPGQKPHETPWVVTLPLVLLAIPSVVIGYLTIGPVLFGDYFKGAIVVDAARHPAMEELAKAFHGAGAMALHGLTALPFWLALAGVVVAWWFYLMQPALPAAIARVFSPVVRLLENKYYMDWINEHVIAAGARMLGRGLWKGGDVAVIDGAIDGSARTVGGIAAVMRTWQTGRLYQYALVMLLGIFGFMTWRLWPFLGGLMR